MSLLTLALLQITKTAKSPFRGNDMSEFEGMTHVTTKSVAQKLGVSQDSARYHVRRMCLAGQLVEDGVEKSVGAKNCSTIKRFKIIRGEINGS